MFENQYIQAWDYRLTASSPVSPALPGDCLLVPLTATRLRMNGGAAIDLREHEAYWSNTGIDTIDADGDGEAWIVIAQFKGESSFEPPVVATDNAMLVEPATYSLIFENHRARVAWVTSRPGEKTVMHSHPARVFRYFIAPNTIRTIGPDGDVRELSPAAGTVLWREEAMVHTMVNIGDTVGQLVLIEVR